MWDRVVPDSSVPVKYILFAAQKDKAIELWDKLDDFRDKFMVDLAIEIRVKQGLMCLILIVQLVWLTVSDAMADDMKSMTAGIENI